MVKRFKILLIEIKFLFIRLKSYWVDWIAGNVNLLLGLIFLYLGINSFKDDVNSIDKIGLKTVQMIVGLYTFVIIQEGIGGLVSRISEGKNSGVFEQIVVNPYGSWFILLCKSIAGAVVTVLSLFVFVPFAMVITGKYFSVNIIKLIFLLIPLYMATIGIGFIIGGLTLIFRRLQSFAYLIQFLVLTLMVLPSYPFSVYSLLPIAPQSMVINKAIAYHISISYKWWIYLYMNGFIYFTAGVLVYKHLEEIAREKGVLGHY